MNDTAMSSYKALVAQSGSPITEEEFQDLRGYANVHSIKLSGFKDFVGDIQIIKTVIDDIYVISEDFPLIVDEKQGVWLELDYNLGTDFATTRGEHIIHLNAGYYSDIEELEKEYEKAVADGRFVKGTDWRTISRHEIGHVVANLYHIDPLEIALSIKGKMSKAELLEILGDELSLYSTEYNDGREIISESFSGFYGGTGNAFAEAFVEKCKKVGEQNEII